MNRISMLGPTTVTIDGEPRRLTAPKQRAVLAQLALEPAVALTADRLLDEVWGEQIPAGGAKAVAFQITKLRDVLEPDRRGEGTLIRTTAGGYALDVDARQIDIHDVAAVIEDAGRAVGDDPVKARYLAEDALAMWRGQPFVDVPESASIEEETRRLGLLQDRAHRLLFESALALGAHDEVLADVARYVERHPLDEAATALLMRALDNSGRTAEALRAFGALRRRLVEELGIDPSPELGELEMSILTRERAEVETTAPLTTEPPPPTPSLPRPVTPLVGRERDIATTLDRLAEPECRALTLTGPGGIGKSRLALEVAHRWDDGPARFVSLAALDGDGVVEHIADSIGFVIDQHIISSGLDSRTQLLDYLVPQRGLLVLDNYEHVLHEVGLVESIAERCPDITVLVTSREPLGVPAEWMSRLSGLSLDGTDAEAPRLFISRSQQAGAVLTAADREHVQRVCVATEGMPLALELSAALTPLMAVADIADHVESHAADLESTLANDGDGRHRSLRATFDQSWSTLDPTLQQALARLAVFSGAFDADAAEQVAGAGRSSLARLQMKSLLRRSGPQRFDLHPLVRQFALSQLGDDADRARAAHADYFAGVLAQLRPVMLGSPDQMEAVRVVDDEIDDMKAAAMWFASTVTLADHDDRLVEMLHGLSAYWCIRSMVVWATALRTIADAIEQHLGHDEAMATASFRWARVYHCYGQSLFDHDAVLPLMAEMREHLGDLHPHATAWCLVDLAVCAESSGDIQQALALMEEASAIDHADEPLLSCVVASWHGWEAAQLGRPEEAGEIWRRGLARAEQDHNLMARGYLLSKVGLWAEDNDEFEIAMQCHRDAAEIFRETGDRGGLGYAYSRLSWTQRLTGDTDGAIASAQAGLEEFRAVNHRWGIGASMGRLGHAHLTSGSVTTAASWFRSCLDWGEQSAMPTIVCYGLIGTAWTLLAVDDHERAAVLLAHNAAVEQNPYAPQTEPGLAEAGAALPPEQFEAATERGRSMEMTDAVLFARHCADEIAGVTATPAATADR